MKKFTIIFAAFLLLPIYGYSQEWIMVIAAGNYCNEFTYNGPMGSINNEKFRHLYLPSPHPTSIPSFTLTEINCNSKFTAAVTSSQITKISDDYYLFRDNPMGLSHFWVHFRVVKPVIATVSCGSVYLESNLPNYQSETPYHYTWQLTNDLTDASLFKNLPDRPPGWIQITSSDITALGLSLDQPLYARVIGGRSYNLNLKSLFSESFRYKAAAPLFTATPTPGLPLCNGGDGSVAIAITSKDAAVSNFELTVDRTGAQSFSRNLDGVLTDVVPALKAGTYTFTLKNKTYAGPTCFSTQTVTINEPSPVTVPFPPSSVTHVSCYGASTGAVTLAPTGGKGPPYNFAWNTGPGTSTLSNSATLSGRKAGTYYFSVTDGNGCEATGNRSVTIDHQSDSIAITITSPKIVNNIYEVSCSTKHDGSVTASARGGSPPYTYKWDGEPPSPDSTHRNRGPGTYTVVVTDSKGCTKTKSSSRLEAAPDIAFSLNSSINACAGGKSASLWVNSPPNQVGGPLSYSWSVPTNNTGYRIDNLRAGIYSVTVSDSRGSLCAITKLDTLTDPPAHTVSLSPVKPPQFHGSTISCHGKKDGTLTSTVRNASSAVDTASFYQWFKNDAPLPSKNGLITIDELDEGTYKVVATYNGNCIAKDSIFLKAPDLVVPLPAITSNYNGLPIKCTGDSTARLTASASGGTTTASETYRYKWGSSITFVSDPALNNVRAGTYVVTAKDANGCEGTASIPIIDPSPVAPTIRLDSAITCFGKPDAKITATGAGGAGVLNGYTYSWNTGATGATINKRPAGTYTVTARDANDCPGINSIVVVNPDSAKVAIKALTNFNGAAISCYGSPNGSLEAVGSGGTGAFTYQWNTLSLSTSPVISELAAGTYIVTAKDAKNCSAKDTFDIVNPAKVKAQITKTSDYHGYGISCAGENDGYLIAKGTGGTGALSYRWLTTTEQNDTLSNVVAGTYTVRVQDLNGCFADADSTLTQPLPLTLSLESDVDIKCFGRNTGEIRLNASGGVSGYEYSRNGTTWQPDATFDSLRAQGYTLRVRDRNSCVTTFDNTLTQPEQLTISFTDVEPAFCSDPRGKARAVVAGGMGGYTYAWRNPANAIFDTDALIENLKPGRYTLTSIDANNCPVEDFIGIVSADGPQVSVKEMNPALCSYSADGSALVEASGNGPFDYEWPNGQTTDRATSLAQGKYIVTVTDKNDCPTTHPVIVTAPDTLAVQLIESVQPSCFGDANGKLKVAGTGGVGGYSYAWATSTGDEATGLRKGDYTVTVTDGNACTAQKKFGLNEPERLQINMKDRVLPLCFDACNGVLEAAATGGNGNYSYTWDAGRNTARAAQLCAGNHVVTVVDAKGCTTSSSISLGQPPSLQLRLLANQPPDCHDGCNGKLTVDAVGGTGAYQWKWSNGAAAAAIEKICAGQYKMTVTDANSCAATADYTVTNPPTLVVNLGGGVTLCEGQTHTLDAGPNWKTTIWKGSGNLASTEQKVVVKTPGQYWLEVYSNQGCVARDTFLLETSLDLLKARFMLPSQAHAGDTIVMIDVSWPLPETTLWVCPPEMTKLVDNGDVIYGQFKDPGVYPFTLAASLGQCKDKMTKSITILEGKKKATGGRLSYEEFVKEFSLYPNPNGGTFDVRVEVLEDSPITLSVWSTLQPVLMGKRSNQGKKEYLEHIDLAPLSPGIYVLRLDHERGKEYIRFVVH
jgi:hypothetical protein